MSVRFAPAPRGARRNVLRDAGGNVLMLFGLTLLPMLGAVGLAVDFGSILIARNNAQVAADAAALQAAGVARELIKNSDGSAAATATALAEAKRRAEGLFAAHADRAGLDGFTSKVTVTRSGQNLKSSVEYSVTKSTFVFSVFNHRTTTANGTAQSSSSLPSYVDVYVLMDVSQSMGLAATNAEAIRLFGLAGCVFGCHVKRTGDAKPLEQVAHANGIRLRIDVLRDAVMRMIVDAENNSYGDSTYRFGLYSMSLDKSLSSHALNEISAISGNYTTLKTAAEKIDLSSNNDQDGLGDSHINNQLEQLKLKVAKSGDGSSQAKSKVYVFLVTDGLRDYRISGPRNQHITGPIDPLACAPFKTASAGITMGVLYTTYLPIYKNPNYPANGLQSDYVSLVKPHELTIAPALRACASSGWFFEASDDGGITAAFDKMFEQTSSTPKLTN